MNKELLHYIVFVTYRLHWNCRPVQGQQVIDVPKFPDVHATKETNNVNIIEDIL